MSPARSSVTPSTHAFRVRILGGFYAPPHARQIWRELELTGDQTLGDLGEAIPLAFGFDDPHLWSFFLSGKPWDEATEYALSPSPDPASGSRRARAADRLRIRDVPAGKEFLFLFDYGDEWHFGVRLVRSGMPPNPGVRYPQVIASHGQAPPQYPAVEDDWDERAEDEEFLAQWAQAEAEAVGVLRQALPPQVRPPLPAGDLAAACLRLRAGLGRHDPAVETIRRAAALDPPLPANDAELWLAAAGALIAMRNPSGLDPELEAAVMALELADWVGAVVGLVRGGAGANAEPAALVAAINECPEVDGTVDPDDADLVELAFEAVLPTWEAVGAVDADRRLTALGAWGLPRALVRAWDSDLDAT
jgi:pRiA4b ORF-3-like protein